MWKMAPGSIVLLLALSAAYFASCSGSEFLAGAMTGAVTDAVTGLSMRNVEVKVPLWSALQKVNVPEHLKGNLKSDDDYVYATAITNNEGKYAMHFPLLTDQVAYYDVSFSAGNYPTTSIKNVDVRANEETVVEELPFIDSRTFSMGGSSAVSGVVKNAFTNTVEGGVVVNIRVGRGVTTGPIVATITSGSSGAWSTMLRTGYYTAEFVKAGFVTADKGITAVGGANMSPQNIQISPNVPFGEIRAVLRWSESPLDLDSHMIDPGFRVYYSSRGNIHLFPYCHLDADERNGFGPETITIKQQPGGRYRYAVHDYSNRYTSTQALSNSKASVQLIYNGVERTFHVPPRMTGNVWTVFELDGNGVIRRDTFSYQMDPSYV